MTHAPVALVVGTRPESIKMAPVADQLGRTIAALDTAVTDIRPEVVVVQGDTTSALAANDRPRQPAS